MEVSLDVCDENFIAELKRQLGDDDNCSPNWADTSSTTIGIAYGAACWNVVLWQGNQYWVLGDDIFKYCKNKGE